MITSGPTGTIPEENTNPMLMKAERDLFEGMNDNKVNQNKPDNQAFFLTENIECQKEDDTHETVEPIIKDVSASEELIRQH